MKKVTRTVTQFETADGRKFDVDAEADAIAHEFKIKVRGLIQSNHMRTHLRNEVITLADVCNCIADNADEMSNIIRGYRRTMQAFIRRNQIPDPLAPAMGR